MIDRTKAPKINKIDNIKYQIPEIITLSNGIKLYLLNNPNFEVVKVDVVFKAGVEFQKKKLQAFFSNSLLKEAPIGMLPNQTAELFDYYGAYIESFVASEEAGIRLFIPNVFIKKVIPVFADLFIKPSLPQKEFEILQNKQFQSIQNNLCKTKYVSIQNLNNQLFGNDSPRGYLLSPTDAQNINISEIESFVKSYYKASNCFIIISGNVNTEIVELCKKCFDSNSETPWNDKTPIVPPKYKINESAEKLKYIKMADSVQSTISIGKNLGNLNDNELLDLSILNVVLGGYFGSRLMKNIREDKGYTYGIDSIVVEYPQSACIKIITDAGVHITQQTIDEIFKEIEILSQKPISEHELKLVKNYMLGDIISSFDGVFNSSEILTKLIIKQKQCEYIEKQIERIKTIKPIDLLNTANRYFGLDSFKIAVAGKL